MTIQKIFVFSLMTMLLTLFVMYVNIEHPAINVNMGSALLSDEVLMGSALFIIYLLLSSFYPKKASRRLIK
ncbi:hypothetical protein [Nitrosomonas ureae]|uniref:Uncharacterized protein n=1 Tax=Nitrosomonas ureae TaxID=44577 RepID=A0A1H5SXU6_9PROT|nr:hypothetical protein [Nitrosomonas ureae]SEF55370.1 hypothetical protein SAMN05216334_103146 [Nitrosomonas ureae]